MREEGERCDSTSNSTPIEAVIPGLSKTLIAPGLGLLVCVCAHTSFSLTNRLRGKFL